MKTVSRMQALAAAVLFSTSGAAIKAVSLTSWQVASFRSGIAAGRKPRAPESGLT